MVVRVVKEQDVKPIEPGPLEALFNRRHDPVVSEVPHWSDGRNVLVERFAEVELAVVAWRIRPEKPANFGRDDDFVTRKVGNGSPHPLLGERAAVYRSSVDVPPALG